MTDKEIDETLNKIEETLEPCLLCKGKAEILGMHVTLKEVVIDKVGCRKCHLSVERKWSLASNTTKIFPQRITTIIDPVFIWNHRTGLGKE